MEKKQLKTITQLWEDASHGFLVVAKPSWHSGYCVKIRLLEGQFAIGDAYCFDAQGHRKLYEKDKTLRNDEAKYYSLSEEKHDANNTTIAFSIPGNSQAKVLSQKEDITSDTNVNNISQSNTIVRRKSNKYEYNRYNVAHNKLLRVKVGCTVEYIDCEKHRVFNYKIVPSHEVIRYKTMGYKTKKYIETTQDSEANCIDSISDVSPIGKALLDHCAGDEITVLVNNTYRRYKILNVVFNND